MKFALALICLLFFIPSYASNASNYGDIRVYDIASVYDGDTFKVNIKDWPSIIGANTSIRIKGVDTPELRSQCSIEKKLALSAKTFTQQKLADAEIIELKNIERGKYFRLLADVYIDGENLAELLIQHGHGYIYAGGKRRSWC